MPNKTSLFAAILLGAMTFFPSPGRAAAFTSRELFRIPFNADREGLGAREENGQFSFPKDFTLDGLGRFYIYDSKKHRVARYSPIGAYEIGFNYPETAQRVFAHADDRQNLWLLISDPHRGVYYGVYDAKGKRLREGIFAQFHQFRLHLDDAYGLYVVLSSTRSARAETFVLDQNSLLMKKQNIAPPPAEHHQLVQNERLFYIDAVPNGAHDAHAINRITDAARRPVAQIRGRVIYMTASGEIYTRLSSCEINVYDVGGKLKGSVKLPGMPSSCDAIRFNSNGDIYQLDGIPEADGRYSAAMAGMRMVLWERQK